MSTYTEHISLIKPDQDERYDISVLNTNMDLIDSVLSDIDKNSKTQDNEIKTHIGNNDNPHDVTKSHVGLSNVENKSSEDIRKEITSTNIEDALGFLPYSRKHIDDMFYEFEINSGGNGIYCSTTEPNEAANGMLWIDESENPENVDEETSDNHQDE